jgi:hypothetical protein
MGLAISINPVSLAKDAKGVSYPDISQITRFWSLVQEFPQSYGALLSYFTNRKSIEINHVVSERLITGRNRRPSPPTSSLSP